MKCFLLENLLPIKSNTKCDTILMSTLLPSVASTPSPSHTILTYCMLDYYIQQIHHPNAVEPNLIQLDPNFINVYINGILVLSSLSLVYLFYTMSGYVVIWKFSLIKTLTLKMTYKKELVEANNVERRERENESNGKNYQRCLRPDNYAKMASLEVYRHYYALVY